MHRRSKAIFIAAASAASVLFLVITLYGFEGNMASSTSSRRSKPKVLVSIAGTTSTAEPGASFCVPWSFNASEIDDWWTKNPTWFNHLNNRTHTCFELRNDTDADLYLQLHNMQFPASCDIIRPHQMSNMGWGSSWGSLYRPLIAALNDPSKGPLIVSPVKTLRLPGGQYYWKYAKNVCPENDMACYFLPLSNCTVPANASSGNQPLVTKNPLFEAAVYQYASRPRHWLRKRVYDLVANYSHITTPCTVMHVRRGDLSTDKGRQFYAVSEYINELPNVTSGFYNNRTIFLMTDDANAIDEAFEFFPDFKWAYLDRPRMNGALTKNWSGIAGSSHHIPSGNPASEVIMILATEQLVERCDSIVFGGSEFARHMHFTMSRHDTSVTATRMPKTLQHFALHKNMTLDERRISNEEHVRTILEELRAKKAKIISHSERS